MRDMTSHWQGSVCCLPLLYPFSAMQGQTVGPRVWDLESRERYSASVIGDQ